MKHTSELGSKGAKLTDKEKQCMTRLATKLTEKEEQYILGSWLVSYV